MHQNESENSLSVNIRGCVFLFIIIFVPIVLVPQCCSMYNYTYSTHLTKGRLNDLIIDRMVRTATYRYQFYVDKKKYQETAENNKLKDTLYNIHYRRQKCIGKEIIVRYEPTNPFSFNEIDWERTDSLYNTHDYGWY